MKRRTYLASVAALIAGCQTQESSKPTKTTSTPTRTETPTAASSTTTTETTTRTRTPTETTTETTQTPTTTTTTTRTTTVQTTTATTTQRPEPQLTVEIAHSFTDKTQVHKWTVETANPTNHAVTYQPQLLVWLNDGDNPPDEVLRAECVSKLPAGGTTTTVFEYDADNTPHPVWRWEFRAKNLTYTDNGSGC